MARLCPGFSANKHILLFEIRTNWKYLSKIIMLKSLNICLNVAKSSTLHEEQRQQRNITLPMLLCVVFIYLIDLMVINVEPLGEGGANLPVCTDYAEFMHLQLIA